MKIAHWLRRTARQMSFRTHGDRRSREAKAADNDVEDLIRVMSDQEFIEYLRLHSKSHRWKV